MVFIWGMNGPLLFRHKSKCLNGRPIKYQGFWLTSTECLTDKSMNAG